MRILLVADIHANWPALRAIDESFDLCFFLGDVVDYGLEPSPCIDWLRQNATHSVRGNHDHGVSQCVSVAGNSGFRYLTTVTRPLMHQKLTVEDRRYLQKLPISKLVNIKNGPESTRFLLVHASPRDPLDEYTSPDPEFWRRRLTHCQADVICVGHTHLPYVIEVDHKLVINPGSVGQPRDGDPRASYAIIEDKHVQLKRIDYPIEESVNVVQNSPLPETAKAWLTEILRTGSLPKVASSHKKIAATQN